MFSSASLRACVIQVTLGTGATGRNLLALQVLELGDLLRRQLLGQVPPSGRAVVGCGPT
jgi:hypothetical protein